MSRKRGLVFTGRQAGREVLTPRLSLRLMPEAFLLASLQDGVDAAEAIIGLKCSPAWFQEKALMSLRLADCRSDPEYCPWSLRAIGLRSSAEMIGHIGFHSRPHPAYLRQFVPEGIELGYTIFTGYRRAGYATEAIRGLINWAAPEHGIDHFVVSVAPTNFPSVALAAKLGFRKVGEHQDEIDGPEDVYVLSGEPLAKLLAASW